jgi:hypothetical protein
VSLAYYIYYRVPLEQAEPAKRLVAKLQRELLERTGVHGRLMRRRDDPATWMEIYEDVPDEKSFETALSQVLQGSGFSDVLVPGSQRITETFVTV